MANFEVHNPVFVHRIWECAGADLIAIFSSDVYAHKLAQWMIDEGREPEKTCIVVTNSYNGEARRFGFPLKEGL